MSFFGFGASKEERIQIARDSKKELKDKLKLTRAKDAELLTRSKEIELERILSAFKEVIIFPGSKKEFEKFIGYKTSFVDLGKKDKGLIYDCRKDASNPFRLYEQDFQRKIADSGVVALVNSNLAMSSEWGYVDRYLYGMPVKKLK